MVTMHAVWAQGKIAQRRTMVNYVPQSNLLYNLQLHINPGAVTPCVYFALLIPLSWGLIDVRVFNLALSCRNIIH